MLIKPQIVTVSWNGTTKKYFESKGYVFTKKDDKFQVLVDDLPQNSTTRVKVKCDCCDKKYELEYRNYLKKTDNDKKSLFCKSCSLKNRKRPNKEKEKYFNYFLDFCDCFGYTPISTIDNYTGVNGRLEYICPKHGLQTTCVETAKRKNGCTFCRKEEIAEGYKLSQEEIIKRVENINNNKILNPQDYVNSRTNNLQIVCGSCGNIFTTSLSSLTNSSGHCKECGVKVCTDAGRLTPNEVEHRINSVNGNKLLNKEEYVSNNTVNLKIKCGGCGDIFTTSLANYEYSKTDRCPSCSHFRSKGEKIIYECLKEQNVIFEEQKKFDNCRDSRMLPFDFYLPNRKMIIEFDGRQHFEPVFGEESFQATKKHDEIKNNFCTNNNINLVRIPYYWGEYIEDVIDIALKTYPNII